MRCSTRESWKTEDGRIVFPFDAVRVNFVLSGGLT